MASSKGAKEKEGPTSAQAGVKAAMYVAIGAGHLVVEKATELTEAAKHLAKAPREETLKAATKVYEDLAARGEKVAASVRESPYARAAVKQTKAATGTAAKQTKTVRRSVKAAGTGVKKAGTGVKKAGTGVKKAVDVASDAARTVAKSIG
jgi:hypothetical protein